MKKWKLFSGCLVMAALLVSSTAMAQFYPDGRPIYPSKRGSYYGYGGTREVTSRFSPNVYTGFRIGMTVGTVNSDSPYLDGNRAKVGLNAGVVVGTQLTTVAPLYFEGGLYYTQKGGESKYEGSKFTYALDYLELPLTFKYKIPVANDLTVDPLIGGYLALGVAGKIKDFNHRAAYGSFSDDYRDGFSRFDGGLRLGCGLSFDMLYLEASYDIGLANVGKDYFDDTHTGAFNLTCGINF